MRSVNRREKTLGLFGAALIVLQSNPALADLGMVPTANEGKMMLYFLAAVVTLVYLSSR